MILLIYRLRMIVAAALLLSVVLLAGCEDCAGDYNICVSQIPSEELQSFSYDYTCMYPTMAVGNARAYCQCQEQYQSCVSD